MDELEDMMFMEAVRLSLAAEEERKRKEEKQKAKQFNDFKREVAVNHELADVRLPVEAIMRDVQQRLTRQNFGGGRRVGQGFGKCHKNNAPNSIRPIIGDVRFLFKASSLRIEGIEL